MWPLPLDRMPSCGCQAGPSPPELLSASTFSFAPGTKMSSSAALVATTAVRLSTTVMSVRIGENSIPARRASEGLLALACASGWYSGPFCAFVEAEDVAADLDQVAGAEWRRAVDALVVDEGAVRRPRVMQEIAIALL